MKNFSLIIAGIVAMLLSACSGGDTLSCISEKIQGPLKDYFEVVPNDYKTSDGKVSIEIKRIKEGFPAPWKEGMEVGYNNGQVEPRFTVEFQNSDGNVVSKDKTDIVSDMDELNAVAALGVDETATITFECKEGATQFKMGSTFKSHGEEEKTLNLEGGIGQYPIMMTIHIASNGEVTGAYYYKSKGPGNYLYVKGEKSDDHITLNEFTRDGKQTGTYEGTYTNGVYKGHFNTKSGNYEFVLKPTDMADINFSNVDFDSFRAEYITYDSGESSDESFESDEESVSSASGSEDWNALLDSYEQYVDKYIKYIKKAANGDMTALAEYPSLMEKAQELSNKMSGAQGEMSASQWSRYIKINNKMAKAAQEMQ